jgi:hypothetical protein
MSDQDDRYDDAQAEKQLEVDASQNPFDDDEDGEYMEPDHELF